MVCLLEAMPWLHKGERPYMGYSTVDPAHIAPTDGCKPLPGAHLSTASLADGFTA